MHLESFNLWDLFRFEDKKLEREHYELIHGHGEKSEIYEFLYRHFGLNAANKKFFKVNTEAGNI